MRHIVGVIRLANRDETNAGVRTEATALAEALGCLPLAIVVAGGYLNFHSKTTFEEYRTDFEKRCSQFFGVPSANSDNAVLQFQIVAAAWDKTLEKEGFAKVAVFGL